MGGVGVQGPLGEAIPPQGEVQVGGLEVWRIPANRKAEVGVRWAWDLKEAWPGPEGSRRLAQVVWAEMQVPGRGAGSRQGPPQPAEDRLLTAPHQPQRQSLLLIRTRVPSRPHLLQPQSPPEGHLADTATVGIGASARGLGGHTPSIHSVSSRHPWASALAGISGRQRGAPSVCAPNRQGVAPTGTCCLQPAHGSRPPCRAPGSCPSDSSEGQAGPAQHSRRDGGTRCGRAPSGRPPTSPHSRGSLLLSRLCRRRGRLFLDGLWHHRTSEEGSESPRGVIAA